MIKLGSQEVTKIMKGSEGVVTAYKGGDEVWSSYEPPPGLVPSWGNVKLLINAEGFPDNSQDYGSWDASSSKKTISHIGGSGKISEAQKQHGDASIYQDAGRFDLSSQEVGSDSWTFEFWMKADAFTSSALAQIAGKWTNNSSSDRSWQINYSVDNDLIELMHSPAGSSYQRASTAYIVPDRWVHFAVVYEKDTKDFSLFIGGRKSITIPNCNPIQPSNEWWLGGIKNGESVQGYFDDIRLTVSEALYTENFKPPGPLPLPEGFDGDLAKVFTTHLYTGERSPSKNITSGIDLLNGAGLVWTKCRTGGSLTYSNGLIDTLRGAGKEVRSDSVIKETYDGTRIKSWRKDGYEVGQSYRYNDRSNDYVSWTFMKERQFFDMQEVTLPGGNAPFTFSHDLGAKPGMVLLKRLDEDGPWNTYISEIGNSKLMYLNNEGYAMTDGDRWRDPTSDTFTVGPELNSAGDYIAYLFANDASPESVIKHGSFPGRDSTVDLGWEPQWVLMKATSSTSPWTILDQKRGWAGSSVNQNNPLRPNEDSSERQNDSSLGGLTSTGFYVGNVGNANYIYLAVRKDQSAFMRRLEEEKDSE